MANFPPLIVIFLLAFPFLSTASTQGMGKVTMQGQIYESACSIHTDDIWQEIPFGVIAYNDIYKESSVITRPFSIRLINCALERNNGDLWQSVNITFGGDTEVFHPDVFKVYGEAQGLGLRILNQSGDIAHSGVPMPNVNLQKNNNELHYLLSLVRNGKALSEGNWYSVIRFMVSYQ